MFYDAPFLPGTSILVVNSFQAMKELLGERSGTYSDRPKLVVVGELMGLSQVSGLSSAIYGAKRLIGFWFRPRPFYLPLPPGIYIDDYFIHI